MENLQAMRRADEVRTFPDIQMPAPAAFTVHTGKTMFSRTKDLLADKKTKKDSTPLPGLLKAKRTNLTSGPRASIGDKTNVFTGFNSIGVKLDVVSETPRAYEDLLKVSASQPTPTAMNQKAVKPVALGSDLPDAEATTSSLVAGQARNLRADATVEELRNYIVLMDKYSLHNFLIYDGHALKDTPEFQSFQRSYQHQWGSIAAIVRQLEEFLSKHDIKLAIVNGPRIVQMGKLNLPILKRAELLSCLANSAQIEANIDSGSDFAKKQALQCVIKIQAAARMHLARKRYKATLRNVRAAIVIQSFARRMIEKRMHRLRLKRNAAVLDEQWQRNRQRLDSWWREQQAAGVPPVPVTNAIAATPSAPMPLAAPPSPALSTVSKLGHGRVVIFLPSLSIAEKIRLECDNYAAVQNTCVSQFYQLADPSVQLVYISPMPFTSFQSTYHEKFLALMGISILPKRLHVLVPEMSDKLAPYMTLAQQLWCSVQVLRKIKSYIRRARHAELVCTSMGWAERRIAAYLGVPLVAGDPNHAQILSNRSVLKSVLMEANVSIPIGAHDVNSMEDLFVALARLIAANLGVMRWILRLNCDPNQESAVVIDVEKISLVVDLRNEQREVIGEKESLAAWFARPVQIEVRKRIMQALKTDLLQVMRFARKDIYKTWDQYLRQIHHVGAVVEAEPLERLGTVISPCFITPLGEVQQLGGVEAITDDFGQVQAYVYPQQVTPPPALHGVSEAIAKRLFEEQQMFGHVSLHFTSHWDGLDGQPRLWGTDVVWGSGPLFGAMGTAAVMARNAPPAMPLSLLPAIPEGRSFVYIPLAVHEPLKGTRDDNFFKLCRLRGVAYDTETKIGTLFLLVDSIMGGGISILCVGKSRKKSIELAVQALTFVQRNYGLDMTAGTSNKHENLTNMLSNLKALMKREGDIPLHAMTHLGMR